MPSINNVVLTDRATTPVNHTLAPIGREGDGARYAKAGLAPNGDMSLTIAPRKTPQGRRKVDISLSLPILQAETINGVTVYTTARTSRAKVSFDIAPTATEQERKDLVGMLASALASGTAQVNDVVVKGEMVY